MMKMLLAVTAALLIAPLSLKAQAPAGSTGQCKDGSYTSVASKSGACRGHKGIQTWYAAAPATTAGTAPKATPATMAKPATPAPAMKPATPAPAPAMAMKPAPAPAAPATPAAAPAAKPAPAAKSGSAKQPAPGGGPGMVWVNTSTKVYHCPGGEDYGTTKAGKYMSEADAKAAGAHAAYNKPCSAK